MAHSEGDRITDPDRSSLLLATLEQGGIANLTIAANLYFGTIDLGTTGSGEFFADEAYKVFVAAITPEGVAGVPTGTYLLSNTLGWTYYTGGPLPVYLDNVTVDATQHAYVSILQNADVSGLIGARLFVGWGTDDQEMLAAERYREIFVAQPDDTP